MFRPNMQDSMPTEAQIRAGGLYAAVNDYGSPCDHRHRTPLAAEVCARKMPRGGVVRQRDPDTLSAWYLTDED